MLNSPLAKTPRLSYPCLDKGKGKNADQVLAVYDLCQMISATLMVRHRDELIERMIELDQLRGYEHPIPIEEDPNYELPFDDPLP